MKQKEAKTLLSKLREGLMIPPELLPMLKAPVELAEVEDEEIFIVNHKLAFGRANGTFFPVLTSRVLLSKLPGVVVDMGAVRFVTNGADVMAPGIIDADLKIVENDQVWICDEIHRKPLAIGIANMTGEQMRNEKKGKAIKTIHYVGDNIWKSCYSL